MSARLKQLQALIYATIVRILPMPVKFRLKHYWFYVRFLFRLYVLRETPILVYQMGKVGSSSIYKSLEMHGMLAFNVHNLDPSYLQSVLKSGYDYWTFRRNQVISNHIVKKRKHAKVITIVRDPISNTVSRYFHMLDHFTSVPDAHTTLTVDELIAIFVEKYAGLDVPLTWFDTEFHAVTGINIYDHEFPEDTGFQHLSNGWLDILLMKLEIDDSIKTQAINDLLGIEDFQLDTRFNVGSEKGYAEVYKAFKQKLEYPQESIIMYCESRLMQHFYTPEEIARFRARWERKLQ